MLKISLSQLALFTVSFICLLTYPVTAQITPDNSLGSENSIVTPNITVKDTIADLIEGGAIRGSNLFHSFSDFNIGDGAGVYFANPNGVANILTRVTGNNISEIFGTVGVLKDTASHIDGAANLFLLNPNGIVFGENAALDVNGSFLATTAESYIFDNGFAYSASNPDKPPLLTINIPVGIQFGSHTGDIQVLGTGQKIITQANSNLSIPDISITIATPANANLEVAEGKTLSLVGGNVNLQGSSLRAKQGRIELGGVDSGFVALQPTSFGWNLDYTEVSALKNLNLQEFSAIDASGLTSQGIQLAGKQIKVKDGSVALIQTIGSAPEADITVTATELVTVSSIEPQSLISSGFVIENFGLDTGDLTITAPNLIVKDGAAIGSRQLSVGKASDTYLDISDSIIVSGVSSVVPSYYSRIGAFNRGSGEGGDLNISTKKLLVENGANIGSITVFGSGDGGNVNIRATELIEITGKSRDGLSSSINASSLGDGNGGSISIETKKLILNNGGDIDSVTIANGNGGEVFINASESIELINTNNDDLDLTRIGTNNFDSSSLKSLLGLPEISEGNSGKITINTPRLSLIGNSEIAVANQGKGNGGNLEINASSIVLENGANILASTASGEGGNIVLQISDSLLLQDGSSISAEAKKTGNGGNIFIDADTVAILNQGSITANAIEGNGGNIDIITQGLFVSPDSLISASSEFGLDGNVEIESINGDRQFELNQLPENITDLTNLITVTCSAKDNNAVAIIGNGGVPKSPYQAQSLNTAWYDLRPVKQEAAKVASVPAPLTEATTTMINSDGELELVALTPLSSHRWIKSSC